MEQNGDGFMTRIQNPEFLSAYPGIQPLLYILLIVVCFVFVIGLVVKIILTHKKNQFEPIPQLEKPE